MQVWRLGACGLMPLLAACFGPSLPAVDCGQGNICPANLVCQLPERVCVASAADAAAVLDGPTDGNATDGQPLPAMVDRGLLARYFIDEAADGTGPAALVDSAPAPLSLPITYGQNLEFKTEDGHRGLDWDVAGAGGTVFASIGNSKLDVLDGSRRSTLELVVDIDALSPLVSRLVQIGPGNQDGDVALASGDPGSVGLAWQDAGFIAAWPFSLVSADRVVLHVVFDSELNGGSDRLRLYADGALINGRQGATPGINDEITLDNNAELSFGNRSDADRSIEGMIFYVAIYSSALSGTEVASNGARLRISDDK